MGNSQIQDSHLASVQLSVNTLPSDTRGLIEDGCHSFNELYHYRMLYNAMLFNQWSTQQLFNVHKSIRHYDGGLCFDGYYFIVVALLPTGQITNHYPMKDWNLFKVKETDKALYEYDGHTPQDVVQRITDFINSY